MTDERKPMANIPPFGLRMQPDLKARIEAAAKANNRSMNAEIVVRLEASFASQDRFESGFEEMSEDEQAAAIQLMSEVGALFMKYKLKKDPTLKEKYGLETDEPNLKNINRLIQEKKDKKP